MLVLLRILAMQSFLLEKAGGEGGSGSGDSGDGKGGDPNPGGEGDGSPGGNDPGGDGNDDPSDDGANWTPAQTKTYIKNLRKENASYRKKAKEAGTKITSLEERFGKLEGGLQSLTGDPKKKESVEEKMDRLEKSIADRNTKDDEQKAIDDMNAAVQETADALGVAAEGMDYFRFLIQQEAAKLDDDEEVSQKVLVGLAELTKKAFGKKKATTGIGGGGTHPDPKGGGDGTTVEQFVLMTIAEKSVIYVKDREAYDRLMQESKLKKLIK